MRLKMDFWAIFRSKFTRFVYKYPCYCMDSRLVLVYQMGKVGSSTVVNSLDRIGVPVIQLHELNYCGRICGANYFYRTRTIFEYFRNLVTGGIFTLIYMPVRLRLLFGNVRVITMVRDPIERMTSNFFDYLRLRKIDVNSLKTDELEKLFFETVNTSVFDEWFDREVKKYLKIDIYEKGKILNGSKYDGVRGNSLLVIRNEEINRSLCLISDFVGETVVSFVDSNRSMHRRSSDGQYFSQKQRALLRESLKKSDIARRIYSGKYFESFYGQSG